MFLANFRVAISWAFKQPLYYAIKVVGLALGIMSVALLVAYVGFVGQNDAYITDRDQIFRLVGETVSRDTGERVRYDVGSNAWIDPFRNEFADLYDGAGVLVGRNGVFAHETSVFYEEYYFADADALRSGSLPGPPALRRATAVA